MKLKQMAQMKWVETEAAAGERERGEAEGEAVAVAEAGQSLLCADNDNTK